MVSGTLEQVVKHSFLYSYLLSQPFATYVDAYPVLQNKLLLEAQDLEYGEHSEIVRVLQQKLKRISYYNDDIDGGYGILTEYALKKFQADYNIQITGQADRKTIIALIEMEMESHLERLKNLSETVYPGLKDNNVTIVQEALHYFGYYSGKVDGIYGPLTQRALEIAEEEHDIKLSDGSLLGLDVIEEENKSLDPIEKSVTNKDIALSEDEINKQEKSNDIKVIESRGTNHSGIIQAAQSFIGTPYVWGGSSPGGFDCSGFINFVFESQNINIPRTVSEIWNFSTPVDTPSVGNLVFFETYQPGPSHLGIYLGDGKFIHAGSSRGVEVSELNNSYWDSKYLGAKKVQ